MATCNHLNQQRTSLHFKLRSFGPIPVNLWGIMLRAAREGIRQSRGKQEREEGNIARLSESQGANLLTTAMHTSPFDVFLSRVAGHNLIWNILEHSRNPVKNY
eukprot:749499-Hanusia_phi.AAC.4